KDRSCKPSSRRSSRWKRRFGNWPDSRADFASRTRFLSRELIHLARELKLLDRGDAGTWRSARENRRVARANRPVSQANRRVTHANRPISHANSRVSHANSRVSHANRAGCTCKQGQLHMQTGESHPEPQRRRRISEYATVAHFEILRRLRGSG